MCTMAWRARAVHHQRKQEQSDARELFIGAWENWRRVTRARTFFLLCATTMRIGTYCIAGHSNSSAQPSASADTQAQACEAMS